MGRLRWFPIIILIYLLTNVAPSNAATQELTATLNEIKEVTTNGGNITAVIDPTTGTFSAALTPGFTLITNTSASTPVTLKASINTSSGDENALFGTGSTGSTYILLGNTTILPTSSAVSDAASGSPSSSNNPNVIAYPVNAPADISGELTYTWDALNFFWNGNLTHTNNTNTLLEIPASSPRTNTFSIEDQDGSYQTIIILSFV